jgi:GNAT superfamily N-acetyltransferase
MAEAAGFPVREATLDDVDHIVRHRAMMFADMGMYGPDQFVELVPVSERYFREALTNGGYRGWIVETDAGRVIAGGGVVISAWPAYPHSAEPRKAWILNLYTEPEYRRRGIARRLMAIMIEWCRDEGFPSVSLHASNEGRVLYRAMGFQPTNEMRLNLR